MESFDLRAKDFDTEMRINRAKLISDTIRRYINNDKGKSAMEYGCGTGLVGMNLLSLFDSLLFVDSSQEMIKQVDNKIKDLRISNALAICQDVSVSTDHLPEFDYIFMSLVLHHIKDTEMILSRLKTLLKEEGHLLIVDLDKEDGSFHAMHSDFDGHNGFDQAELIELSQKVGFRKSKSNIFYRGKFENRISEYSLFILDCEK